MAKRIWLLFSLILMISSMLSGCGAAAAQQRPPLKVEWTDWEGDYTLLIAQHEGLFEKHGVQVETIYYEAYSKVIPDLASHQIDAGLVGVSDVFSLNRSTPIKTVCIYDSGGAVAVVSTSDIASVADLKGKKVGAVYGDYGEMFVRYMLDQAGLTIADVQLVDMSPELISGALSKGEISAGYVWSPLHHQAEQAGHKILYTQAAASLAPDVIVFRADVAKARPDDVRAFLDAWFEAVAFRVEYPEASGRIIASATNRPLSAVVIDPELKLNSREDNLAYFNSDPSSESSIYSVAQVVLDFKIGRGDITVAPDLQTIFDPSFLK